MKQSGGCNPEGRRGSRLPCLRRGFDRLWLRLWVRSCVDSLEVTVHAKRNG